MLNNRVEVAIQSATELVVSVHNLMAAHATQPKRFASYEAEAVVHSEAMEAYKAACILLRDVYKENADK